MLKYCLLFLISYLCSSSFALTDADLSGVQNASKQKKETVVIYTWSPHMPLSIKGLDEIRAHAGRNRWILVVARDPLSNLELAKSVVKRRKWPTHYLKPIESSIVGNKGVQNHYPNYTFLQNGNFVGPMIPGYKTTSELTRFTSRFLK